MNGKTISFGDTVRVLATSVTRNAGYADLVGTVYGETQPSVTGVEVIGDLEGDHAINVHFKETDASVWFDPRLLQFVDHGAGQEITLDGVDKKWVRNQSGEWIEQPTGKPSGRARPWWKFW
jgi:hypothetical protein